MGRRLIISLLYIMAAVTQVAAQGVIGSLKIHPIFGNSITKIIDTGDMVYYLSDNTLFSYDKANDESDSYSRNNRLNDSFIKDIYYNYDRNYLAVVYENSNIDVLTADGRTVNLPDIYDADIQTERVINDITFADGRMLVATDFGYVVFNDNRFEVEFSRIFNAEVHSVAATDDYIWVNADYLYYTPIDNPGYTLADMTATPLRENAKLLPKPDDPTTGNAILFAGGWLYSPYIDNNGIYGVDIDSQEGARYIQPTREGFIAITGNGSKLLYLNVRGFVNSTYTIPEELTGSLFSSMEEEGNLWELSTKGIRHISLDTSGGTTVLSDYYRPNASSVLQPFNLVFNDITGTLLVANSGQTNVNNVYNKLPTTISSLSTGWWSDILPDNMTFSSPASDGILTSIYHPIFSPFDPETYFMGTRFEGALKIKGNKVVMKYDADNCPFDDTTFGDSPAICVPALQFDAAGNLWLIQASGTTKVLVLPNDKVQSSNITASDWITVNLPIPSTLSFKLQMYITRRNDIKIILNGDFDGSIYFVYDNGNPASTSIQSASFAPGQLYDQDGTGYSWHYLTCLAEDADGNVWLGTDNGVVRFNPANAFASNFSVTRPRIPRNDGTNFADNLLDGITVTSIAVDGGNRKWITTAGNGIYLVNPDGSEVLRHYTSENSPLPSDETYSVCCATNSNSVFVGTSAGVVEIYSDASQPSPDFDNAYAYPNPVRPEYNGDIAIVGLMDNSLVKIADSAGNVVRSLQSIGGTAIWDGCNSSGQRVKTGVYYVLGSQSDGSNKNGGVVTKILFIN